MLDPATVGLGYEVLVNLTMARKTSRPAPRANEAVAEVIEVCHGERMFGDTLRLHEGVRPSMPN